mgnify:CR=1 FL=1
MPPIARTLIVLCFQAIVCAGALAITRALPDPAALKTPIMLVGILGLLPALAWRMKAAGLKYGSHSWPTGQSLDQRGL